MNVELKNYKKLDQTRDEAYKALRANITFLGKHVRVIAVTSTLANEGKSDVTFNTAHAFAETSRKTLIIDADNRNSSMLETLGVEGEVKVLADYLSGEVDDCSEIICETDVPYLSIIFARPKTANPSELLDSKRFKELIAAVRNDYDYVFIDCPPLGAVIDAAIVARETDGVILVIEEGTADRKAIRKVKEQLEKANVRILGTVLNKALVDGNTASESGYYDED